MEKFPLNKGQELPELPGRSEVEGYPYSLEAVRRKHVRKATVLAPIELEKMLDACPRGTGPAYENIVMRSLEVVLDEIIEQELVRSQFPAAAGRGDIELPLRCDVCETTRFCQSWISRYHIKSILAEVKNLKGRAEVEHARQIKDYLDTAKRGHFAFLISRNGFRQSTLEQLREYADNHETLILPLEHRDVRLLLKMRRENPPQIGRFFGRTETLLLRVSEQRTRE